MALGMTRSRYAYESLNTFFFFHFFYEVGQTMALVLSYLKNTSNMVNEEFDPFLFYFIYLFFNEKKI